MTVRELIEQLQTVDPEAIVVLSCDPEGNGFWKVEDISEEMLSEDYAEYGFLEKELVDKARTGDIQSLIDTGVIEDEKDCDDLEEKIKSLDELKSAVCIWP